MYTIGSKKDLPFLCGVGTVSVKGSLIPLNNNISSSPHTSLPKMLLLTIINWPSIGSMGGTCLMSKLNILGCHIAHLAR